METLQIQEQHQSLKKDVNFNSNSMKLNLFVIVLATCFLSSSCSTQEKDKKIINDFVMNVFLKEDFDFTKTDKYLTVSKDSLNKDSKILEIIENKAKLFGAYLKDKDYQILSYNDVDLSLSQDLDIDYKNLDEVYFLMIKDEFVTLFLVQDNRVSSFFTGNGETALVKSSNYGGNSKKPYVFKD